MSCHVGFSGRPVSRRRGPRGVFRPCFALGRAVFVIDSARTGARERSARVARGAARYFLVSRRDLWRNPI